MGEACYEHGNSAGAAVLPPPATHSLGLCREAEKEQHSLKMAARLGAPAFTKCFPLCHSREFCAAGQRRWSRNPKQREPLLFLIAVEEEPIRALC